MVVIYPREAAKGCLIGYIKAVSLARLVWIVPPLFFELLKRLIDLQCLFIPPRHAELELLHSHSALLTAFTGGLLVAALPLLELTTAAGRGKQLGNGRVLLHC